MASPQLVQQYQTLLAKAPLGMAQRTQLTAVASTASDAELQETIAQLTPLIHTYTNLPDDTKEALEHVSLDVKAMTPEMLWGLSETRLKSTQTINALQEYLMILAGDRDMVTAYEVIRALDAIIDRHAAWEKEAPDLLHAYARLSALAEYIRLPALSRLELRDLFERNFLVVLQSDLDVIACIDDFIITYTSFEPSKRLAGDIETIIAGIRNNEEMIGILPLDRGERGMVPPTIRNWLIDYEAAFSSEKPRGAVEESAYLSQSKNVKKLAPADHALLEKVLKIFDTFLFPGRHQDVVVQTPFLRAATPKPPQSFGISAIIPPASRPASTVVPATMTTEQETDAREMKKQLRAKGNDPIRILFDLVITPHGAGAASADALVAGLTLLAEDNLLEKAVIAPNVREGFEAYLRAKNQPDLLGGFKLAPTMPRFMSLFLQWVLQDRGGLSEHDAARVGVRIANILKKHGNEKYARIAYFDATTNTFKWS